MRKLFLGLAIAYSLLIAFLSLSKFILGKLPPVTNSDKVAHFLAYFVFVAIWGCYFMTLKNKEPKSIALKSFVLGFVFGLLMELMQYMLTSYRTFDLLDVLANTLGGGFGAVIVIFLLKQLLKRKILN